MFLDSPALLLSEEWERVGKKAKSRDTFEATLFLRMSDGRASLASVGLFLENFLSEESRISFRTMAIDVPKLRECHYIMDDTEACESTYYAKGEKLHLRGSFKRLIGFLCSSENAPRVKEIQVYRVDFLEAKEKLQELESKELLAKLEYILVHYQNLERMVVNFSEIDLMREENKSVEEHSHLLESTKIIQ